MQWFCVSSFTASKILVGIWPLFFELGEAERIDEISRCLNI